MNCSFVQDGDYCVCTRCQRRLKRSEQPCNKIYAACGQGGTPRDPFKCVYFLGGTDESTEAGGRCGCASAKPLINVCECELHGRCTPTMSSKDESIAWCMNCEDFEAETAE
jgi:hypothetical protein